MIRIVKPVVRETLSMFRGKPLVAELRQRSILLREKGKRTGYELTYDQIFTFAATRCADLARQERWRNRGRKFA